MTEKLQRLYNTLLGVETKGKSTIIMGTCLSYLEGLVREASKTPNPNQNRLICRQNQWWI